MGRAPVVLLGKQSVLPWVHTFLSAVVAAGLSAGCAPGEDSQALDRSPEAACRKSGGSLRPVGKLQSIQCVVAYPDAGRSCHSSTQCRGDCRVPAGDDARPGQPVAGVCQATSDRFGCWAKVEGGRAQPAICID
jgi:hypothetical protein